MRKTALLAALLLSSSLSAQTVQQSGSVTPNHPVRWVTNGIIGDGGTAASPLFPSIGTVGEGPTFCANSAAITGPYTQLCFAPYTSQASQISLFNYNGAAADGLTFNINGTLYAFPYTVGGIVGPGSSTGGDYACWNNTAGSLLKDCGATIPLAAGGLGGSQSAATANQVPVYPGSGGAAVPALVSASSLAAGAATSNIGTLGGDLSGTLPNPTVAKVQGLAWRSGQTYTSNQAPLWNSSNSDFEPGTIANSVSNSDGSLTISPTGGAVVASLNVAHANTWTANQAVSLSQNTDTNLSVQNTNVGASASGTMSVTTNAGSALLQASSTAGSAVATVRWTGSGTFFIDALNAAGNLNFRTGAGPTTALNIDSSQLITMPAIATDATHTDRTVCEDTTTHALYSGSGTAGICLGTSGRQFKTAFKPMLAGLQEIDRLKLWNYRYKPGFGDNGARMQYGPTAQDVALVLPDLVRRNDKGEIINYDIGAFIPISLRAIQQLDAKVRELEAKIVKLERTAKHHDR